jgi:ABC-2 type transport system ATP-binding protein
VDDGELGVAVADVWRGFGPVQALSGATLSAPYGRVTALIGPNGAGKTTLLLILATLLKPDRGRVRVGGLDAVADPVGVRARMGWMPDVFGVYDQLTVREYLDFFAASYRLDRSARATRVSELLALIHLEQYAGRPVHVLSRGQKQRLAMARALVHQPRVLLLDEPASGLDPRSRLELRDTLRSLAAEKVAVLVSSHILSELEEIADRVVLMTGGRTTGQYEMSELGGESRVAYRIRVTGGRALIAALASRVPAPAVSAPVQVAVSAPVPAVVPASEAAATAPDAVPDAVVPDAVPDAVVPRVPAQSSGPDAAAGELPDGPAEVVLPPMTEDEAADLLAAVVGAGVRVVAYEPLHSRLESAYLAMTEGRG